jgi:hypothetical protein
MGASNEPCVEGYYSISGSTVTVMPEVKYVADDFLATVVVAQYSSQGQMKSMQVMSHIGNGVVTVPKTFTHAAGDVYRAYLLLPDTEDWGGYIWKPMNQWYELQTAMG